jgi:predicted Rossmann-fold nucleotide-binding protein
VCVTCVVQDCRFAAYGYECGSDVERLLGKRGLVGGGGIGIMEWWWQGMPDARSILVQRCV